MNLTQEQLKRIEDLANRTIPVQLIAAAIEVDELELIDEICLPGTTARNAYLKGMLQQMVETRESIIKAAHNGSNPAQAELLRFLNSQISILHG
jgi:hypothetical protein